MGTPRSARKGDAKTETKRVTLSDARTRLSELVSIAAYKNERFAIVRYGKTIAALVSAEDLARLDGAA